MAQEYRSCVEGLKANRNSHLWSMYQRRPRKAAYLRSFLVGDLVGLVGVLFGSSRSRTAGRLDSMEAKRNQSGRCHVASGAELNLG